MKNIQLVKNQPDFNCSFFFFLPLGNVGVEQCCSLVQYRYPLCSNELSNWLNALWNLSLREEFSPRNLIAT